MCDSFILRGRFRWELEVEGAGELGGDLVGRALHTRLKYLGPTPS